MRFSHTFLTLAAVGGLWWGGHLLWSAGMPATEAKPATPFFGVPGSAYGSLMARLMRDTLYSYWHGGETAAAAAPVAKPEGEAPPPPPAGRFARRGQPIAPQPPAPEPKPAARKPWLEQRVLDLARLEAQRTKRNSAFPMSPAHRRFVNASAGWRLRVAYQLDPGDAVLYEILHFHLAGQLAGKPAVQQQLVALAEQAIQNAERPNAGMSAALTGAGAAVNLLNDLLRPGQAQRDDEAILLRWAQLDRCLARYQAMRQQSIEEGWWAGIPSVRQEEIESHANLLGRIAQHIRKQLPAAKVSVELRHRWQRSAFAAGCPRLTTRHFFRERPMKSKGGNER